jgi:hypothetical protein
VSTPRRPGDSTTAADGDDHGALDGAPTEPHHALADTDPAEPAPLEGAATEPDARAAGRRQAGRAPLNAHERLRGLSLAQQLKVARDGEASERMVLERLYGKAVWEALLRNPRLSHPEVAHLARMGALPRPLIELIVANPGWLQSPQVRRALLANPRLGGEQIDKVLRATPKNELRLVPSQTAYPLAVRSAARKFLPATR